MDVKGGEESYHLESIELLLDLLREHRRQTIASSDLSSAIILRACPSIMIVRCVLPRDIAFRGRCCRRALRHSAIEAEGRHEVVLAVERDRLGAAVPMHIGVRGAWCRRWR